jgi:NlpC/P60 family
MDEMQKVISRTGLMKTNFNKKLLPISSLIFTLILVSMSCGFPGAVRPASSAVQSGTSTQTVTNLSSTPTISSSKSNPMSIATANSQYRFKNYSDPDRTMVTAADGHWLATFTNQAYTVTLLGPERTFSDPNAKAAVVTNVWVRVLSTPFNGKVDQNWLTKELQDSTPDVFAIAMQYVAGAPALIDNKGLQIAGEAKYGPVKEDDTREEGGDFNDYLGIPWKFGSQQRNPKSVFFHSLDCSGFMRMVWGYRVGLPLAYVPDNGGSIPRHSWEMLASAPGTIIIPDTETQVTDFSLLAPGDLVFFHAKIENHNPQIDHVGIFLGKDTAGHFRFISSRQTINGPTFGDVGGNSLLDGTGLYARSFRAARRL